MKLVNVIFLLLIQATIIAAEGKDVLRQIRSNYASLKSCESEMSYRIYRGFDSKEPVESYGGYFCRDGESSYRKIDRNEFFNFAGEGIFLQVDHRDQSMYLGTAVAENLFDADLEKSLKQCGNIIVTDQGGVLLVSLILSKSYDLPYSRIDIEVTEDYWIRSMTLFYASKANFSKVFNQPDMDQVRMEIRYETFNKSWQDKEGKLTASNYISQVDGLYQPSALYKNYAITDLRKKQE